MAPTVDKELDPKHMDQKEYWWCTVLKCWCRHKPEDCRGAGGGNQGIEQAYSLSDWALLSAQKLFVFEERSPSAIDAIFEFNIEAVVEGDDRP